ncbi:MAG: sigma-54-dependent Fis family transcriptional regulator [Deltaproteobacteria bacterium]|nr:sigma-54-dependent Fis family transcriptional regulator [Deltaproteobacteria bacterium]
MNTENKEKILVIDDEPGMREMFRRLLKDSVVLLAKDGYEGIEIVKKEDPDIVISDLKMPKMDGIEVLKNIKEYNSTIPIILITAYATIETAVEAIKIGAYDYITKPFDPDVIEITIKNALQHKRLLDENRYLREKLKAMQEREKIIGESTAMKEVFSLVEKVAPTDATVLIQGESGTGKELIAQAIHKNSLRADKTFLSINCSAFPETLLESELFGYEKGSFTGAVRSKEGLFEAANMGTLFLDEIGEMPPSLQVKLLRVLQDGLILRIGSRRPFTVDVRIISATNKNLKKEVEAGNFREDLFYRINIFTINLPPLRERKEDIPLLLHYFLLKYNKKFSKSVETISPAFMNFLMNYHWPGNVREIENLMERGVLMSEGKQLDISTLPDELRDKSKMEIPSYDTLTFREAKERFEKDYIQSLLKKHEGRVSRAAIEAGMPRPNFYEKLKKYNIPYKKEST